MTIGCFIAEEAPKTETSMLMVDPLKEFVDVNVVKSTRLVKHPEHPLFRARGRSMLSGDRQSFNAYADGVAASRSDGASVSDTRRIRRRSISITPEIGDDIVRMPLVILNIERINGKTCKNRIKKHQSPSQAKRSFFPSFKLLIESTKKRGPISLLKR
ncbi:hypothetical protein QJS04_geneDACA000832 [Acorus gramineus]|uniref:Uncharacterized protein n=1 Tax=Acorus gramineus TaxID=55184 RepID=A0AAV9BE98_ACOGR|nr:hypothetical protein QJS04_geneDACA000832 [Acorus gramineus]